MGVRISLTFVDQAAQAGDADARALLLPRAQTDSAAGVDLVAAVGTVLEPGAQAKISTGICVAIPKGYEGQVRPRSGLASRSGVTVLNAPGTIDADYRGEIGVLLINHGQKALTIKRGDRVAQLVVVEVPSVTFDVVDSLSATTRGDAGFGSTGRA